MSFVPSLLQAIVRVDGEALVMHAGDKPYVVSPTGQVELANRGLTLEAVNGVVNQLLPVELQQALEEFGAVQYELPAMPEFPGEHFTVVAARGGDDLWTEIRRRRVPDDDRVPEEFFAPQASAPAEEQGPVPQAVIPHGVTAAPPRPGPPPVVSQAAAPPSPPAPPVWRVMPLPSVASPPMPIGSLDELPGDRFDNDDLHLPNAAQLWPERPEPDDDRESEEAEEIEIDLDLDADVDVDDEEEPEPPPAWQPAAAPPPVVLLPVAPPPPVAEVRTTPWLATPAATVTAAPRQPSPSPVISQHAAPSSPPAPPAWQVVPLPPVAPPPLLIASLDEVSGDHLADDDLHLPNEAQVLPERSAPEDDDEREEGEEIEIDLDADVEEEEPEPPPAWQRAAAPPPVAPPALVAEVRATPPPVAKVPATPPPVAEVRATPPPAAEVRATPPPAAEVRATPPPVAKVPATPPPAAEVRATPPPVAEVPPLAAPGAKVTAPLRLEVPTAEVATTAPPVVTEQPPAAQATESVAPPVVTEEPPAVPGSMQRIFRAMQRHRLTASAEPPVDVPTHEVAAATSPPVTEQPPAVQVPMSNAVPPLDLPTPRFDAAVLPVVAKQPPAVEAPMASAAPPRVPPAPPPGQPAIVLPIARGPVRSEQPPPMVSDPTLSGLERLLRVSAARGASALYLSSGSRPSVRVDGELQTLDAEPVQISRDVQSLLLSLMPERSHEALRTGAAAEWIVDIEGVGRVRCMSFRDHLGPGAVFRLMPTRSISADQLGLPRQVQALANEPEGLVLVAGPRSSGKRTLMAAYVDLMNRTRRDHIITIEREINIVHERGLSFISQREVRGNDDEMLAAARGALREDPDVLVIEDLRSGPLMSVALEAAAAGRLVVGGFSAHTATGAIDRIIGWYAPEYRGQVQLALADSLRGVIVQELLRKIGGGRLPAREVLLNTPAVSGVIAEGKTSQLPMAIEGGRRDGMMPLNDTLVGLVQNGSVEAREAYRRSPDRPGFLAALNRQGLDTSFVERLA